MLLNKVSAVYGCVDAGILPGLQQHRGCTGTGNIPQARAAAKTLNSFSAAGFVLLPNIANR